MVEWFSTNGLWFLQLFGVPAIVAASIAAFAAQTFARGAIERYKAVLKSEYDAKLEALKVQLKSASDLELERQKHSLAMEAARQSYRFQKLHERRAEAIASTYAELVKVYLALKDYVKPFEPAGGSDKETRRKAFSDAFRSLDEHFQYKKIFLPKAIADNLDGIRLEMLHKMSDFLWSVEWRNDFDSAKWSEIYRSVDGPIQESLHELENHLRSALGDEM